MARQGNSKDSSNTPWSESELLSSVKVYILLLRLQQEAGEFQSEPTAQALLANKLDLRNDAAIRYRLRNISAVVQEIGGPILSDFSPAESVGKNVRARIREMLEADEDFGKVKATNLGNPSDLAADALSALDGLREYIEGLNEDLAWRGHNQPPEPTGIAFLETSQLAQALADIERLKIEVLKPEPDAKKIEEVRQKLLELAVSAAKWIGERLTKFSDVALATAAPILVAKATGFLPVAIDAIEAVSRLVAK